MVGAASVRQTRLDCFVVTVRSSWAGSDGLPTAERAWVSAPGFDALAQRGEVGGFLQGRGDDEFGVRGVAEEPGPGGVDAPVAFDLFCDRLGQGPAARVVRPAEPPGVIGRSPARSVENSSASSQRSASSTRIAAAAAAAGQSQSALGADEVPGRVGDQGAVPGGGPERSDGCGAGRRAGDDQQQGQQEQQDAVGAVGVHQRLLGRTRTETEGSRRSFNVVRRSRTAARIGSRRLRAAALSWAAVVARDL